MLAHGFTNEQLVELVRAALATVRDERMRAGGTHARRYGEEIMSRKAATRRPRAPKVKSTNLPRASAAVVDDQPNQKLRAPRYGYVDRYCAFIDILKISDAVAISTLATGGGLVRLFQVIEALAVDLLKEGYFIRGALTKGTLYHDDTTAFGEALIRTYELENTVARYPRVMITRDVMADINRF